MKLKSPDPLKSWLVCCVVAVKLIMMHNVNSNYFSSLHTNSFALILLLYESSTYMDQNLVKQLYMTFLFYQLNFQQ